MRLCSDILISPVWLLWHILMLEPKIKNGDLVTKTGGWFDEEWPVMSNQICLTIQAPPVWSSSEQSGISCSPQPYHKVVLLVLSSSARKGSKAQNLFISLSRSKVLVSQRRLILGIWEYIDQTLYCADYLYLDIIQRKWGGVVVLLTRFFFAKNTILFANPLWLFHLSSLYHADFIRIFIFAFSETHVTKKSPSWNLC